MPGLMQGVGTALLMSVLAVVAILLQLAPVGLAPAALPSPQLLWVVVLFFALHRPEAVPLPLVFALGILGDLLGDGPVGARTMALLLAVWIARRYLVGLVRESPILELGVFAALCGAGHLLVWLLLRLSFAGPPRLLHLLLLVLFSTLAYLPMMLLSQLRQRARMRR